MKKRNIIISIVLFIIVGIIFSIATYAGTGKLYTNLTIQDLEGVGYGIGNPNNGGNYLWYMNTYDSEKGEVSEVQKNIYCLKAEYGASWTSISESSKIVEYNMFFDLQEEREELSSKLVDNGDDADDIVQALLDENGEQYKQILWLLDNMYIRDDTDNKEKYLAKAGIVKDEDEGDYYNINTDVLYGTELLTDADIIALQRAAIWTFTNGGDYNLTENSYWLNITTDGSNYSSLSESRDLMATDLYNYLVSSAKTGASLYTEENNYSISDIPVEIDTTDMISENGIYKLTTEINNSDYIAGPVIINKNNDLLYKISMKVTDENGTEINNYTFTDVNGNSLGNVTLDDLIGRTEGFYIKVASDLATKVNVEIQTTYYNTVKNLWLNGTETTTQVTLTGEQPVAEFSREEKIVTMQFVAQPEFTEVTVNKSWDDENNQDGIRPESINVILKNGETTVDTVILNEENNWTYTFSNLPKSLNGTDINYTVVEEPIPEEYTAQTTDDADTVFTITNTHTPEEIEIPVTKVWEDSNNQDAIRPESISVTLKNGETAVETITLNEENNWTYTFIDLPKYTNGNEINYTVEETGVPEGYISETTGDITNGYTITNTHIPEKVEIPVTKVWEDNSNQDGLRPSSINVNLKNGETTVDTVILSEENNWIHTFTNLPKYTNGNEINYTVEETEVPEKYTSETTGNIEEGYTITNTYTPELIEIPITKVWEDNNNQDGIRPESITVDLKNENITVETATLNEENNWTHTFTDLPKYANGTEIDYTIEETSGAEGYEVKTTGDITNGYIITNTHIPEEIEIPVTKVWEDNSNQDGLRPSSINVNLKNGETTVETITLNQANSWTYTFTNLPKYTNGNEINYTVEEIGVPEGYISETTGDITNGYTITNTHIPEKIEIPITKVWEDNDNQDGLRPESITVDLKNEDITVETVTLNEENNWTHTFTDLPKYANGTEIDYTIEETSGTEGYEAKITGDITNGYTITNTHIPEEIEISVTKVWNDRNNQDGIRPEEITVILSSYVAFEQRAIATQVEEIILNEENNWTYTFTDLPKYSDGNELQYVVLEEGLPDGYTSEITGDMTSGYTITNTHKIFDLALRKNITKVNGQNVSNTRIPNIDESTLETGTTATYKHRKDAVQIESGDIITYQITIYNEGEKAGYASQIIDQLPTGLKYKSATTITSNKNTYSVTYDETTNKVTFNLANSTENPPVDIQSYTTGNLDKEIIEIECEVVEEADTTNRKILTNVAWISGAYDTEEDKVATDRDSQPETVPSVDKDNMENYKGKDTNKDDLTDSTYYYEGEQDDDDFDKLVIEPESVSVQVTKKWEDTNNQDGIRPNEISVNLKNGETTVDTVTLNETNNWTHTFTNLPKKSNGTEINYTVEEVSVPEGYEAEITGNMTSGYTITNTHKIFDLALRKRIVKVNGENITETRNENLIEDTLETGTTATYPHRKEPVKVQTGDIVTYQLTIYNEGQKSGLAHQIIDQLPAGLQYVGETTIISKDASGADKNTYEVTYDENENYVQLDMNNNLTRAIVIEGNAIQAYEEGNLDKEIIEIQCKVVEEADTTNRKILTNVAWISGAYDTEEDKVATDRDSQPETAPNVNKDNMESYKGKDTNQEDLTDNTYYYEGEQDDDDFEKLVIEPESVDISATKVWEDSNNQDGIRPDSIEIKLLANSQETGKTAVLNETNNWKYTFEKLAKKSGGQEIAYTIQEVATVEGYTSKIEGNMTNGFIITNTHIPEVIEIPVIKVWEDSNNQDGLRPSSISINLKNGETIVDTITLNEANNWKHTFTNLPKNSNGNAINYTVEESGVPDGYTSETTGNMTDGFTITNKYTPGMTSVKVIKVWDDANNQDGLRPDSITVSLLKNGETYKTIELNDSNNWEYTFTDLPEKENGQDIKYTVEEITQIEGYTTKITNNNITSTVAQIQKAANVEYTITNTHEIEKVFDLSLRKYITKVNGIEVANSRVPNIDESTLQTGTTATYKHRKDPVQVQKGNIVTYSITIYNEGEKAGYANQIIDQLPTGLKYKSGSTVISKDKTGNSANTYSVTYDETTNKITFNLVNTTENQPKELQSYTTGNLDKETIEIECEVTAEASKKGSQILTNVAWISGAYDSEDSKAITAEGDDRDSEPGTNPNANKDNMENYKGKDTNKDDLTDDTYFYEGEQDDDDFEKLIIPAAEKEFDLALRKYITKINNNELTTLGLGTRVPNISENTLQSGTTANYRHRKEPVEVEENDIVTYAITIYNEGEKAGYASQIIDQLPTGLIYNPSTKITSKDTNGADKNTYTVTYEASTNKVIFDIVDTTENPAKDLEPYEEGKIDSETLEIKCKVVHKAEAGKNNILTNVAWINEAYDTESNKDITSIGDDRDSEPGTKPNVNKDNMEDYKGKDTNKDDLTDNTYHYEGEQDDDDFEKLYVKTFDLSLRKFVNKVNGNELEESRAPVVDVTPLKNGTGTTAIYNHPKTPVALKVGDTVIYTIRVYNEGEINGYANEVKDYLPPYLEFVKNSTINSKYGWEISDDGRIATTTYLSNKEISAFNGTALDYEDLQIECKVSNSAKPDEKITNIAEISEYKYGEEVVPEDIDSESDNINENLPKDEELPDYKKDEEDKPYVPGNEDDDDFEKVYVKEFDLALRKFITQVQDEEITSRIPKAKDENGVISYEHPKDPITVHTGDVIIYTLRIYNEGEIDGYASEITDDIPEYLEYLPEDSTNVEYMWVMYDENGNETENVEEAVKVKTTYLSKENGENNIIKAYDGQNLYYRDIKIAFKVKDPNSNTYIITNYAQISNDTDENGDEIKDKDSEPDEWNEGEDDQDIENVKVEYFDLSILKFVSKVIVIEDGNEKITETGYNGHEDPEPVVKVDLHKKKLNEVVVKFGYGITVTNEGDIPGYATEITDYVPEGLKFDAADNPDWTDEGNGVISTKQLENTLLQPGESETIEVIFTWINGSENLALKTNIVEISDDKNEYDVPDRDSIPDNKQDGEDDIDIAKVILAITTGAAKTYLTLALGLLAVIATGVTLIKKFVL